MFVAAGKELKETVWALLLFGGFGRASFRFGNITDTLSNTSFTFCFDSLPIEILTSRFDAIALKPVAVVVDTTSWSSGVTLQV